MLYATGGWVGVQDSEDYHSTPREERPTLAFAVDGECQGQQAGAETFDDLVPAHGPYSVHDDVEVLAEDPVEGGGSAVPVGVDAVLLGELLNADPVGVTVVPGLRELFEPSQVRRLCIGLQAAQGGLGLHDVIVGGQCLPVGVHVPHGGIIIGHVVQQALDDSTSLV